MCLAMYLFTNQVLPESSWDKEKPGMYIQNAAGESDSGVLTWRSSEKNVYYIGSSTGCGCGWKPICEEYDEPEEKAQKTADRKVLHQLLKSVDLKNSWLVVCWEGDQGTNMLDPKYLSLENIQDMNFEFEGLRKYVLN